MTPELKQTSEQIISTELIIKKAVEVICGKWRLIIIHLLREKTLRYGEIKRGVPGISEKVLVHELKQLVELGMVDKQSFGEVPPRVEYSLNEKGRTVLPVIDLLREVGQAFI
ncbi:winged helix-turn-helix transcriptional regulator [Larkinella punicea]|jgi:DNA-binding HxlR family transcriptional regulator|uniref:Transcriptional regulator n=1 Tax=Larkinella punicea TaxID=2315727 RepID=A0A368JQG9_9BACT|nr:helix-turn-helix domain-containing protein [Larkinella punicea]RCR69878.1 transcriptional regulator [Larkinella punicea]